MVSFCRKLCWTVAQASSDGYLDGWVLWLLPLLYVLLILCAPHLLVLWHLLSDDTSFSSIADLSPFSVMLTDIEAVGAHVYISMHQLCLCPQRPPLPLCTLYAAAGSQLGGALRVHSWGLQSFFIFMGLWWENNPWFPTLPTKKKSSTGWANYLITAIFRMDRGSPEWERNEETNDLELDKSNVIHWPLTCRSKLLLFWELLPVVLIQKSMKGHN